MSLAIRPDQRLPIGAEQETASRRMSVLKARCISRYQMHAIPGRPEELETNHVHGHHIDGDRKLVISFGYIHGSVRIRQHGGLRNREWQDHRDFTFKEGWLSEVYDYLDEFFGYKPPVIRQEGGQVTIHMNTTGPINTDVMDAFRASGLTIGPRPIKDDPQA